ncbi:MAG TPA: ABC transporter permease, partial [Propioniciclava tarda]|nr:ABC transporter permease [Propioniciclava tarda]HQD61963.1 ABC transporter permease [Propioniciclava tarda]
MPHSTAAATVDKRAGRSPSQIAWDRLKTDKIAIASLGIVIFFVLVAIFAPLLVSLEGEELNK